ncbi:MAG: hypothetical protein JNN00_08110 [Chitinophagaceae bacterium]|nr:hypothetical protein [Chitinophagaceae bacterium]
MTIIRFLYFVFLLFAGAACPGNNNKSQNAIKDRIVTDSSQKVQAVNDDSIKTIHVFVALCDNKYQGIVPVPAAIGNGQDPKTNLYWGAGYGVKSFFLNKSQEWKLVSSIKNPSGNILERLLFRHSFKNVYILADAYDGRFIKQATIDFLSSSSGNKEVAVDINDRILYFGGVADLITYVGHDGLMDFTLQQKFEGDVRKKRETIILACYSKNYFLSHLKPTGATPLLWTSGLMAPEAYTLHDAVREWINNGTPQQIRLAAAKAYSKYQKCSIKAAQNLLLTGF